MDTAVILLTGLIAALAEVPELIKNKNYKELIIFSAFLLGGLGIFVMDHLGVLPSPSKAIEVLVQSIIKVKFGHQ